MIRLWKCLYGKNVKNFKIIKYYYLINKMFFYKLLELIFIWIVFSYFSFFLGYKWKIFLDVSKNLKVLIKEIFTFVKYL